MRLFAGQAEYMIQSSELICGVVKIRPARQGSSIAQYTKFTLQTIHNKQCTTINNTPQHIVYKYLKYAKNTLYIVWL